MRNSKLTIFIMLRSAFLWPWSCQEDTHAFFSKIIFNFKSFSCTLAKRLKQKQQWRIQNMQKQHTFELKTHYHYNPRIHWAPGFVEFVIIFSRFVCVDSIPEVCASQKRLVKIEEAALLTLWPERKHAATNSTCQIELRAKPGHLLSIAYISFSNQTQDCPLKLDLVRIDSKN